MLSVFCKFTVLNLQTILQINSSIMARKNKTLSNEDRHRIVNSYQSGNSVADISRIMAIKRTTVHEVIKKYMKNGTFERLKRGKPRVSKLDNDQIMKIKEWIDQDCTASLKMLAQKCMSEFNVSVSTTTISKHIENFSYSLKRVNLIPVRRNDEISVIDRKVYALKFIDMTSELEDYEFVFIDEVGFNVSMRSSRGRAPIGTPATLTVPSIRSRNISICCAMNKNGIITYMSRNGAFNAEHFCAFINQLSFDTKALNLEKSVLIMDNVKFHKTTAVKDVITEKGFNLQYLPPYSPFLNPLENMFSKWKEFTKRQRPNNEAELMIAIENGKNTVSAADCNGFYKNMLKYIRRCVNGEEIYD